MEVKKYRSINVKLLKPTCYNPYRIKMNEEFYGEWVSINYYHDSIRHYGVIEQAMNFLSNHGFNVVGYSDLYSDHEDDYIIFISDCVREGVRIKEIAKNGG